MLALALLGPAAGCGQAEPPSPELPPVLVETVRVEAGLLVDIAVFGGTLDAEHSVAVKPEIEGVIEAIEFAEGQAVETGHVLFRLGSREQAARLREAKANRALARNRWKRAESLVKNDASSLETQDVAQAEFEGAQARVELAQLELDRTAVRAPFDGFTDQWLVEIGDRVSVDTELTRLDAIDRLQLSFAISDDGIAVARPGMDVVARVRPYPGRRFHGKVFFVSPALDPSNRRLWVKAWIDNEDRKLVPGLFANVDLEVRRIEDAIVVPEAAIAVDRSGPYVWRIDDELRATRVPVEIGLRKPGIVEVIQGLSSGARIVSAGTHKVSEGGRVSVAEDPMLQRAVRTPAQGGRTGEGT